MCPFFGNWGVGWLGGAFMVVLWAVVIGLIIWGVARFSRYGG